MAVKFQVFVSSTFQDLVSERDQVIRAVLEMGHIPVGMEMFSAADDEQWKIIARHIEESDYYAVIVAHRYGSRVGDVSYSRKEYEYAVSCGIPVLGFVIEDGALWPADRVDRAPEDVALLNDFKSLVKQKPVSFWSSAEDLYGKFSVALMKAITANPREGWIRASTAAGPEVMAEITRLSAENARLRAQLSQATRESDADREAELEKVNARLRALKIRFSYRYSTGDTSWQKTKQTSFLEIYDLLAPTLLVEASVEQTAEHLFLFFAEDEKRTTGLVAHNQVRDLFADWSAFDLVAPADRKRSLKDTGEYWTLTSLGRELQKWQRRRFLMSQSAKELQSEEPSEDEGEKGAEGARAAVVKKTTRAKKATAAKMTPSS